MCLVHTGAYVSLLEPGGTDYTACRPRKIAGEKLHVVSITAPTHDRCNSIGENKKEMKRKKKWKGKKKTTNARKDETRRERKGSKIEDTKGKRRKNRKKKIILAEARNWQKTVLGSWRVSSASSMAHRGENAT